MSTSDLDAQIIARQRGEIEALRARLEKAEAERDQLVEQQIAAVNDLQTARNDALEEAATAIQEANSDGLERRICCDGHMCGCQGSTVGEYAAYCIRALKDKS